MARSITHYLRSTISALIFFLSFCLSVEAQAPQLPTAPASTPPAQPQAIDPLGRSTPRGTITAFIRALNREDFVAAARYMQLNNQQRTSAEDLSRDFKDLMDRYFKQTLASISDSPTGALDDALPLDKERLGPFVIANNKTDIVLVRVTDPQSGPIWLISSATLDEIPGLHSEMEKSWLEHVMPPELLAHKLFGISAAQWLLLIASILIPPLIFRLLVKLILRLISSLGADKSGNRIVVPWHERISSPLIAVLTVAAHLVAVQFLGLSLIFRIKYSRGGLVILIIATCWLIKEISGFGFERVRTSMKRQRQTDTESLMLLGQRVFNVILVLVAIFTILRLVGLDTRTALTGLGIGGVAIALGAQKTVENLLGGISLLTDKALAVGDFCCISNRLGTIEDITLRSIRLRTLEQTLLSIPGSVLSQENIENFSTRRKILAKGVLQLRYGTTTEQLRQVLGGIRQLLRDNPMIESESARIRLINFGIRAVELELFAYILTNDRSRFLAEQEALLLQIADVVETSGCAFAIPTQFIYLDTPGDDAGQTTATRAQSDSSGISKRAS